MSKMTQAEYLAILLADNGFATAAQRRGYFEKRFGKGYADELTTAERSLAIDELKDGRTTAPEAEDD